MMLHGIGSEKSVHVVVGDALAADPGERFDVVLANPPFGKKSSTVIVGEDGRSSSEKDTIERDDFWATTSNKQLNFVQHIKTLRTNKHFTLKTNPLRRDELNEFVALYQASNRHLRKTTWSAEADAANGTGPEGRWRAYSYDELIARDKASLDIFWLKDDSLADSDNLPPPAVIAQEIVEDLQAALEQFKLIAGDLGGEVEAVN